MKHLTFFGSRSEGVSVTTFVNLTRHASFEGLETILNNFESILTASNDKSFNLFLQVEEILNFDASAIHIHVFT